MDESKRKQRKKRNIGCVVFVLIFLIGGTLISTKFTDEINSGVTKVNGTIDKINEGGETEATDNEEEKTDQEKYREFDDRTWKDFVEIYGVYQNYIGALDNYSKGDQLNSYNAIKEYKEYFRDKYNSLDYADTEEFKTYLQPLQMICLSSQSACDKTLKHIDTLEMKYLSSAQEDIESVKQAVNMFASNRGTLLIKAGYTDDEIKQKIESEANELE